VTLHGGLTALTSWLQSQGGGITKTVFEKNVIGIRLDPLRDDNVIVFKPRQLEPSAHIFAFEMSSRGLACIKDGCCIASQLT
jgi:hypothetical protein